MMTVYLIALLALSAFTAGLFMAIVAFVEMVLRRRTA